MHIFNEVWCISSIPSKILTQVIHLQKKMNSNKKQFKLLSGQQVLMTEHPDSLRKAQKIQERYKYWNSAKPGTYIMCPHKVFIISCLKENWLQECQKCLSHMTNHCAHIWWGTMLIFNHIQDLHPSDTYVKKLKFNENNSSFRPNTKHSWPSTQVL